MFKKRLIIGITVLVFTTVALYSWPMAYLYSAWQAMPATSSVSASGEPAIAVPTVETPMYGQKMAAVPYYPVKYNEEYFYRSSYNEPIRDYRSYKVKTFVTYHAQNNEPIRDFRYYSDADPNYRIVSTASNLDFNKQHIYRDFRDIPQNYETETASLTY